MTLQIHDHRLSGPGVSHRDTPNVGGPLRPRYLVLHYTAGRDAAGAIATLCNPASKASAHVVLARDGSLTQLAPFDRVTWHAGVSQWNGVSGLNQHAIGIEMDNAGALSHEGSRCVAWFGTAYPPEQVVQATHKHGGGERPWHAYTAEQVERALELALLLVAHYGLEDVLGHDDIARGRKIDPGPAFPLGALRARALGRRDDAPPRYRVTASRLNIRTGPGVEFAPAAPALRQGTELALLEPGDRWSRVERIDVPDVEGWVNNLYIAAVPATPLPAGRAAQAPRAATAASRKVRR